jgi:hypothetical protein
MAAAIGAVGQLVAVIQARLASVASGPGKAPARAPRAARGSNYVPEQLTALIELRVRRLGRDDPQRGRKAFRVFLEVVLLTHFGEHLLGDPKFFQMVDEIQAAMENDAACRTLVDRAIAHLLSET